MSKVKDFLLEISSRALHEAEEQDISIYTIAFYHDCESKAVSIPKGIRIFVLLSRKYIVSNILNKQYMIKT